MTPRPCLDCGTPTTHGPRCPTCQRSRDKARNAQRPWYSDPTYRATRLALKMANNNCWRCGTHLPPGTGTTDHVPPVSQVSDWTQCQLLPACSTCNSANQPHT